MFNRRLTEFGLNPVLGYLGIAAVFVILSSYLFAETEFAPYIFSLIALFFAGRLSDKPRNDFLKSCFSNAGYYKIRLLENSLIALPFAAFLAYDSRFIIGAALIVASVLSALVNFNAHFHFALPTPFYKKPHEFTAGFRNTFFLIAGAYLLVIPAIRADNFNLGVFALSLVFLIALTYYTKPEKEYFVWSHSMTPNRFLFEKVKTAVFFSSLLTLPILVALSVFYVDEIRILAIFQFLGYVFLITVIFAKYSAYPEEMSLPQGMLIALGLFFPPLLIVVIPYFFKQSRKKLKNLLE